MRSYLFASMAYVCCCAVPGFIAAQEIDLLGEKSESPSASVSENFQTTTEKVPLEKTSVSPSDNVGDTATRTVTVYSEAAMANQNAYVVQTPCASCSSGNAGVEFTSNGGAVVQNSYTSPVTYGGNQQDYVTSNSYPQTYASGYSTEAPIQNSYSTYNGGVAYETPSYSTQQYSTSNAGQVVYSGGSYPSNAVSSPATVYPSQSCSSCSQSYSSYPQGNVVYQQSAPVNYDSSNVISSAPQYSSPSSFEVATNSGVDANYVPSSTYASSTYASSSAPEYSNSQMTYTSSAPISTSVPTTNYSTSSPSYSSSISPQPSNSSRSSTGSCQPGLAQSKAVQAAQMRLQGHLGSGLGGASYEGVGWSNQSAQQAIEHCCYWGQRPTAQIGVSKGADGMWYACVLYY